MYKMEIIGYAVFIFVIGCINLPFIIRKTGWWEFNLASFLFCTGLSIKILIDSFLLKI